MPLFVFGEGGPRQRERTKFMLLELVLDVDPMASKKNSEFNLRASLSPF
jgi:hypothetical protein